VLSAFAPITLVFSISYPLSSIMSERSSLTETSVMCEKLLRLARPLTGLACIVEVGVMLGGCAALDGGTKSAPAVMGSLYLSVKDAAETANSTTPAQTKTSRIASPQPPSSSPLSKKAMVKREPSACGTQDACLERLESLLNNPNRDWIGRPQPPAEHADGTRQFAYRALRSKLSCGELARAIDHLSAATRVFAAPVKGVASDRAARVRALDAEVEATLRAERANRCG
jgi:hypothetical protein